MLDGAKNVIGAANVVTSTINSINRFSEVSNGRRYSETSNTYNPLLNEQGINSIAPYFGQNSISNELINQIAAQYQKPYKEQQTTELISGYLQRLVNNKDQQTTTNDYWKLKEKYAYEQAAKFEENYGEILDAIYPGRKK